MSKSVKECVDVEEGELVITDGDIPHSELEENDRVQVVGMKNWAVSGFFQVFMEKDGKEIAVTADKGDIMMLHGRGVLEEKGVEGPVPWE